MIGRAYLREVLNQVWLEISELLDKQVNAQKEKTSRVHPSSRKPTKKCAMKTKETNKEEEIRRA